METGNDLNISRIFVVVITSFLIVTSAVIAIEAAFSGSVQRETYLKSMEVQPYNIKKIKLKQMNDLNSYHWVDYEKGIAGIPIELAIEKALSEFPNNSEASEASGE